MVSGIYPAEFASNQQMMGRGVVIFSENALHGGDEAYYYKGKYKRDGDNNISATVDVGIIRETQRQSLVRSHRIALRSTASQIIRDLRFPGTWRNSRV